MVMPEHPAMIAIAKILTTTLEHDCLVEHWDAMDEMDHSAMLKAIEVLIQNWALLREARDQHLNRKSEETCDECELPMSVCNTLALYRKADEALKRGREETARSYLDEARRYHDRSCHK